MSSLPLLIPCELPSGGQFGLDTHDLRTAAGIDANDPQANPLLAIVVKPAAVSLFDAHLHPDGYDICATLALAPLRGQFDSHTDWIKKQDAGHSC